MITASIVLFNVSEVLLRKVVECADRSTIDIIFIVDNSPNPLWKELLVNTSNKFEYIWGQGNVGFGRAHNIALEKAINKGAEYHVILNPDISFGDEIIERLEHFMREHKDVGCVMPDVVYPDGREQYLCKLLPTPMDIVGRRLLPPSWIRRQNERYEMRLTGYCETRNVPQLSGCFMFLRMSVIEEVGMFDERFFMYFEDIDFCRRIHQKSKTVFFPEIKIVHHHHSEHRGNKALLIESIKSAFQYFNKWGWFFDKERRFINKRAFSEYNIIK